MIFSENRIPPSDQVRGQAFPDHALVPAARRRLTLAQSLRCSIRQAGPRGRSGRAIPISYCSHAIDAGCGLQCLIGEITAHEAFVNFVEIGDTIFHGNLQKIPSPLVCISAKASALCPASHCATFQAESEPTERDGALFAELVRFSRLSVIDVWDMERERAALGGSCKRRRMMRSNGLRKRPVGRGEDKNPSRRCP